MMKKERNSVTKKRFSLVLLLSFFVFCIIVMALAVAMGLVSVFVHFGIMATLDGNVDIYNALLLMGATSLIVGLALAIILGRVTMNPVNHYINQMNRLASGDFSARLSFGRPVGGIPAFKEVEESFNKTAEELQNTEMLRTDFINSFSHEFKTPLVSIGGFAKLLESDDVSDEKKKEYLKIIEKEAFRLAEMATNVLNITKVENQAILSDVTSFNLSEQIRETILLLEPKWSQKEVLWELEFDETEISASKDLIQQVWLNLIDNAVKFSPEGGQITVGVSRSQESVTVFVKNLSEVIPEEERDRLFTKFYRRNASKSEGNGLGLALVKRIVELHGGEVGIECAEGFVTFSVSVPQ